MKSLQSLCRTFESVNLFVILIILAILPNINTALQNFFTLNSYGTILYNNAVPLLGGWGGIRLCETVRMTNIENNSRRYSPPSIVFPGEVASNAELTCLEIKKMGYNAVRFIWRPATSEGDASWKYNENWMNRAIEIAKALGMWIIVDCHGYHDAYQYEEEWLNEWRGVIFRFKDSYEKIVWEPINEPLMYWKDGSHKLTGKDAVNELARIYQRWIDMCRGLGDAHWVVVSHICWWDPLPYVEWFPVVSDPLNRIFLNGHFYYFYEYNMDRWTVEQAQRMADRTFNNVVAVIDKYKRPFLCTEMGATPFTAKYNTVESVPTAQYGGAAGYSTVSFAYIQRLITNFDNYPGRIGYILWTAGDWAKSWPQGWHYGGLFGGMDVWGQLLEYKSFK